MTQIKGANPRSENATVIDIHEALFIQSGRSGRNQYYIINRSNCRFSHQGGRTVWLRTIHGNLNLHAYSNTLQRIRENTPVDVLLFLNTNNDFEIIEIIH